MKQQPAIRLGDLFRSRRQRGRAGLPVISVTMDDGLVDRDSLDRKNNGTLTPEAHLLIRKGDITYNMMRMWQGASGLAEGDGIVSPAYRRLRSFQVASIIYDATVQFCDRFVSKRSRTHDQMVQAARSGRQNIAEGSMASATSKKTELKLTNVAKASLEELLLDYEDYRRFSEMLEEAIRAFREQRLSDAEYLRKVTEIAEKIKNRTGDNIPAVLAHHDVAKAFFGVLQEVFAEHAADEFEPRSVSATASLAIDEIIRNNRIVNWTNNVDVQNRMMSAIEDYLFELKDKQGISLTYEAIDRILEMVIDIARTRYA